MVTLRLGEGADPVGEGQRVGEAREVEEPLEPGNTVAFHQVPGGDLTPELRDLHLGHPGRVAAAGDTAFGGQRAHRVNLPPRRFRAGPGVPPHGPGPSPAPAATHLTPPTGYRQTRREVLSCEPEARHEVLPRRASRRRSGRPAALARTVWSALADLCVSSREQHRSDGAGGASPTRQEIRCGNSYTQLVHNFPQSSTGVEIDGVMRSGGWGPQKATVCRPSASTGTKVLLLERGACAEPGAHTYLMSKRSLDIPHPAAVTCGCRCSHAL